MKLKIMDLTRPMLPQNVALWGIKHSKLTEFEEMAAAGRSL